MTTTVADLKARISVDGVDKVKKDFRDVHSGLSGLAGAFKSGLGAATGFFTGLAGYSIVDKVIGTVTNGLETLFHAGIDVNANLEQMQVAFTTMLGSGEKAKAFLDQLRDFANRTPFEFPELTKDAQLLLAMGIAAKDVIPWMTAIGDATAALGGGPDVLNRIVLALGQMEAKGKASSEEMLQLTEAGIPAWDILAKGIGKSTAETQKLVSQGLIPADRATKIIVAGMEQRYKGLMDKQSQTFSGLISTISDFANTALGKIMAPVFAKAEDGIHKLADALESPQFQAFVDNTAKAIDTALNDIGTIINTVVLPGIQMLEATPLGQTIQGWTDGIMQHFVPSMDSQKGITGATDKAKGKLGALSSQAGTTGGDLDSPSGFTGHVNAAINQIFGLTDAIDPKGAGDKQSHALVPAMRRADDELDKLSASQKAASQSQQQSIPVISGIGDLFQRAGDSIGQFVADVNERLPGAMPQIQRFGTFLNDTFQGALPGLQNQWEGFWAFLSFPVRAAWDAFHGTMNAGLDYLRGDWDQARKDQEQAVENIKNDLLDGLSGIGRFFLGGWQAVVGGWGAAITHLPDLLSPEIKQAQNQLAQKFIDLVYAMGQGVIDTWNENTNNMKQAILNWQHTIQDFINDHMPHIPGINLPGIFGGGPGRASGGPISGDFIGAERGMELLVTPGLYHAPPGSYVYNNQQTREFLSGSASGRSVSVGAPISITVNTPAGAEVAREIERTLRRRDLLTRM